MNSVYRALSDPTRRRILELLRKGDLTAGEIAAHFPQKKPTLSKHFTVLKEADLIQGTRNGTSISYKRLSRTTSKAFPLQEHATSTGCRMGVWRKTYPLSHLTRMEKQKTPFAVT